MKKQVQILGLIAAVIFLFGAAFKVHHYPGASILITLGTVMGVIYMILYLLMGMNSLAKGIEKINGIFGAVVMILVLTGFLFKTMHWPGGQLLVILAMVGLLITGTLMLVDAFKENDLNKQSLKALSSFIIFILIVILFFLTFHNSVPAT